MEATSLFFNKQVNILQKILCTVTCFLKAGNNEMNVFVLLFLHSRNVMSRILYAFHALCWCRDENEFF